MKLRTLILAGTVGVLLTACIPSLYPFYTEKDVVFDTKLLGKWEVTDKEDEPEYWEFEQDGEDRYTLTVTESDGKQGELRATLFKLGDEYFIDLLPKEIEYSPKQADLVGMCMFPGHLLIHVQQVEPTLTMALFDFDWLSDYLEANPNAIAYRSDEDTGTLLTATTKQLQRFVRKHLQEGELFDDYGELTRVPADTESP